MEVRPIDANALNTNDMPSYYGTSVREEDVQKWVDEAPTLDYVPRPQWISVKDRLPKPEQEVLAVCRKRYGLLVVPAIYENGEVDTDDSNWHWYDCDFLYDEEKDVYIIPEGWWENRRFNPEDTFNCPIDVPVTHWMPLPEPPKEE